MQAVHIFHTNAHIVPHFHTQTLQIACTPINACVIFLKCADLSDSIQTISELLVKYNICIVVQKIKHLFLHLRPEKYWIKYDCIIIKKYNKKAKK